MILQLFLVLAFTTETVLSSDLDFSACFGTPIFVDPPLAASSEICKISNFSGPVTNVCELYENDRFKLTFDVEKTVCNVNVNVVASAVDEDDVSLQDYENTVIPANITADHDLNRYYLYLNIRDLPMRRVNFCFVFRGDDFRKFSGIS